MYKNTESIKENFNIKNVIDPTAAIKDLLWMIFIFLVKVCIFGYIIHFCYTYTEYKYDGTIPGLNALYFFLLGSVVMYVVSMLYFMYRCYNTGVSFSDMDFKGYALSSLVGPSLIFSYIIFVTIARAIKVTPLIGAILWAFTNISFLVILSAGFAFSTSFEVVYQLTKCSKK
jgi:hypothetical protein